MCQSCHTKINPLGFTFEHYDGMGGYRTAEPVEADDGMVLAPVDASAEVAAADVRGLVRDAIELSERLAESDAARDCHALTWFEEALSRAAVEEDACALEQIQTAFRASGSLHQLLLDIAVSASMTRVAAPEDAP
jgi:hypothetical protein